MNGIDSGCCGMAGAFGYEKEHYDGNETAKRVSMSEPPSSIQAASGRISGYATPEGTSRYRNRFPAAHPSHFRERDGIVLGSIGIGTYLGSADERTDRLYSESIARAVELGANVVDSAINYRFQRSERSVGRALRDLVAQGFGRDEIVVATKAGFLSFDGVPPRDPRTYFVKAFIETGILDPGDIAGGTHAMAPRFLGHQIETSLRNLGLETIDIFYLHNPETQLDTVDQREFAARILRAFEFLESMVESGRIRSYGTATWNGYRNPEGSPRHLALGELVQCAHEVAGDAHHFRVIQVPFNLSMPEAYLLENQTVRGQPTSALRAASELGLTLMASAALLQARLSRNLPASLREQLPDLASDGQRAIQFVRSTPGVTTALVGMSQPVHVEENLELVGQPCVSPDAIRTLIDAA